MEQERVLSTKATKYFIISYVISMVITGIILGNLSYVVFKFEKIDRIYIILVIGIYFLYYIVKIGYFTKKYAQTYRYFVNSERLDIKEGVIIRKHITIPMFRVQHVSVEQGIILRKMKLAKIVIHTAGSSYNIPALDKTDADELKETILAYSKAREEY